MLSTSLECSKNSALKEMKIVCGKRFQHMKTNKQTKDPAHGLKLQICAMAIQRMNSKLERDAIQRDSQRRP